jgi:hypothetical protein
MMSGTAKQTQALQLRGDGTATANDALPPSIPLKINNTSGSSRSSQKIPPATTLQQVFENERQLMKGRVTDIIKD